MRVGRFVLAITAAWVAGSVVLPKSARTPATAALTGCFADDCTADGFSVEWDEGTMIDADTWVSPWTKFSGGDYIYFHGNFGGRVPYDYSLHLSVSPDPDHDGNNATLAAGNVVLISQKGPDQIMVTNGTCSEYYIRAVLYAAPVPPAAPAADAGDLDAGVLVDATSDPRDADAGNGDAGE